MKINDEKATLDKKTKRKSETDYVSIKQSYGTKHIAKKTSSKKTKPVDISEITIKN